MNKKWMLAALVVSFILPSARLWAEYEAKESAKDEKVETTEEKQHEEQEAMSRYQKAVAKYGQGSVQAKKAWKHVVGEYKEHGDTPPAQMDASASSSTIKQ